MKKKNLAFTLAEVLIVIGIIGVVAALTLPNLNHATGDKEKVTKVKKIYSALSEAVERAQVIYGNIDTWFTDLLDSNGNLENYTTSNQRAAKRITEFMKVSKDCGVGTGCFSSASNTTSFGGDDSGENINISDWYYKVLLSDGTSLAFNTGNDYIEIYFDIDGPNKGKNQFENDIFSASIRFNSNLLENRGQPYGELYPSVSANSLTGNLSDHEFNYGTAWIMQNDNVDYLKCYDELNWETKTSCE